MGKRTRRAEREPNRGANTNPPTPKASAYAKGYGAVNQRKENQMTRIINRPCAASRARDIVRIEFSFHQTAYLLPPILVP